MIIKNSADLPHKKIAVIGFSDLDGKPHPYGKLLAERITTLLVQSKQIIVVERTLIDRILEEQKLSLAGLTSPEKAMEIGSLLNVDAILTGTIAEHDDYYEINARLIDTKTGVIISGAGALESIYGGRGMNKNNSPVVEEEESSKSADTPRVDVIESKLTKIKDGLGEDYYTIRITGKGLYIPSPDRPKEFKDLISVVDVILLDSEGNKISSFKGSFDCGEYGNYENVKANKPFPFKAEDMLVKKELWKKVASYKFIKWTFVR
jgi:TolB-like protein